MGFTGAWFVTNNSKKFGTTYKSAVNIDHRLDRIILKNFRLNHEGGIISRKRTLNCDIDRTDTDNSVFLYYYENRVYKAEDYSRDHTGFRCLTLHNEERDRREWTLDKQYWTNKPVEKINHGLVGTLGITIMKWVRKKLVTERDNDVIEFLAGATLNE
ncbi:MAG: hypothetical protein ACU88J_03550 [Gammaproteobacteria bacterium]